jgi:lipopolysaccharide heptosyltransferase I
MPTHFSSLRAINAERIALIKPSALGDIIHALPVLTALRRRFPAAHLTWVVGSRYEPLLRGHPHLDATLPFERHAVRRGWVAGVASFVRLLRRLRQERFDLVIDLQGLLRSGLMTLATGAARRVGLGSAREGARWSYTDVIPVGNANELHAVDRCWLAAEALGAGDQPREFHLPLDPEAQLWAAAQLQGCARPWLMLGVGARWMTKRWPPPHFAALARRVQQEFGGTVVFVGSGEERPLAQSAARELHGPWLDLTGRTTLLQLAALLVQADVMLANDTGPLHLAAALGRPVVAPYTCTKVQRSGPYSERGRAVESEIWCQGSYRRRCGRLECMQELTPDRLWPHLHEVLSAWPSHSHSA